jgi:hypothetical protein
MLQRNRRTRRLPQQERTCVDPLKLRTHHCPQVIPYRLYALPLSAYSRNIPLRDQRIIKTHTAEGWRHSRRVHTGVLLAGASWREFLDHRNDQSASLLFKGNNMVASFSAFSLRRSGAWSNCLPSLEYNLNPTPLAALSKVLPYVQN